MGRSECWKGQARETNLHQSRAFVVFLVTRCGIRILGTSVEAIDACEESVVKCVWQGEVQGENRYKFVGWLVGDPAGLVISS